VLRCRNRRHVVAAYQAPFPGLCHNPKMALYSTSCHCYENRPFSFFVVLVITGMGDCCDNTSWRRGGKLKLAVPIGLPAGWALLVMSHPSPRLPRFASALLRASLAMTWRDCVAESRLLCHCEERERRGNPRAGRPTGHGALLGKYYAGAVGKPLFSYLRGAGDSRHRGFMRKLMRQSPESPLSTDSGERPKNLGSPWLHFSRFPRSDTGPGNRRGIRALSCVYVDSSLRLRVTC